MKEQLEKIRLSALEALDGPLPLWRSCGSSCWARREN